ncbi:hypothetical protein [Mycobacterium avium]|jgi:hypothetical protein|uniref:Uncharacterized protein n=1 Tax=Mycobacterium avium (strain 104) TaxID=243243 RepID=A0A0H2ZUU2_MYCA1|nr:hypothetical protein [Mycobacterium avium]EUA36904.1 hypothetical protein I549_4594 [Mycobacterium avium subsp. avium 2285 (R)]ABK66254.1 conserved hypothetical protein [Mycobacterium avium 104]KDP07068.1 hypothetical protein MAV101_09690 [Mycobacterium avium subsp. hominissuis 101]MBZ4508194.1 hypothetical protein [Mycobacterium avium subsp. hominissuis]MBZ4517186.1 hypothetical protein [Mycobacterium avium subsp. hominissuis]
MILPNDYIPMPTDLSPPTGPSVAFTAAAAVIVVALLVWWWFSGEGASRWRRKARSFDPWQLIRGMTPRRPNLRPAHADREMRDHG